MCFMQSAKSKLRGGDVSANSQPMTLDITRVAIVLIRLLFVVHRTSLQLLQLSVQNPNRILGENRRQCVDQPP